MDTPSGKTDAGAPAPAAPLEARQRWRITFAREAPGEGDPQGGREYVDLWEAALRRCGLPLATTDAGRVRFALAAPLPARTAGRAELADLWLTERATAWQLRQALEGGLPAAHELVSLEDVWLGAPALAGRVAAADYSVALAAQVDAERLAGAARRLLAAERLMRERAKGGALKSYDLRPLIVSIDVVAEGATVAVRMRTKIHPELGSGRPEEVMAALSDELGVSLEPVGTVRDRLLLSDDLVP